VLCLVGAALLLVLGFAREVHLALALVVVGGVIACDLALLLRVLEVGPVAMTMGNWLPPFGISFTADLMGTSFALVAALVTLALLVYLQMDAPERARRDGLYSLVLLLLAGVSGSFLTGDLFNLYVWFEVMLIASFGLMVLGGRDVQLDGTVKYGFLNFLATTFFLLALGLLYGLTGTLNMADIMRVAPGANPAAMASVAAILLLAFGMKAAAFPVNAWLPASYHTPPAAISALLAGLLTKVGVYALLRTLVALLPASREVLDPVLAAIAVLTLLIAPLGAIAETHLRRALGFLVIGGIGATIAGMALPSAAGIAGSATYILHAMVTMTALYLCAGLVEKLTGEVDTRRMGGLYAAASWPSMLFFVLILAVAGVPPLLGFWPKLLLLEAGLDASGIVGGTIDWGALLLAGALLVNALLTLIAGSRLWAHIFWRAGPDGPMAETPNTRLKPLTRREVWLGLVPTALLTGLVLFAALVPDVLFRLGETAARDLLTPTLYIDAVGLP
ncbi:MAG: Na+/H+ antiporter subunit D, partial [Lysobacteraceae bacterium]